MRVSRECEVGFTSGISPRSLFFFRLGFGVIFAGRKVNGAPTRETQKREKETEPSLD